MNFQTIFLHMINSHKRIALLMFYATFLVYKYDNGHFSKAVLLKIKYEWSKKLQTFILKSDK